MSFTEATAETDPLLTASDILRAADEGVLPRREAERLVEWGRARRTGAPPRVEAEAQKGLNAVTVAYYFGAMLMISACAWFLGDKWNALGSRGVFVTVLVYMGVALGTGGAGERGGARAPEGGR